MQLRGRLQALPISRQAMEKAILQSRATHHCRMRIQCFPLLYVWAATHFKILAAKIVSELRHPSCDAAACCAFMAFFIAKAVERENSLGMLRYTEGHPFPQPRGCARKVPGDMDFFGSAW